VNLAGKLRVLISAPTVSRVYDISRDGAALIATSRTTVGMRGRAPDDPLERELSWFDWTIPAALSPDGRTVLFGEEGSSGGAHYAVCLRGTDGSPPVRLGEGLANDLSPDGAWALTTRFWTSPDLVLLPTGAGEPRVLSPTGLENIAKVHFLPNGDRMVIIGNEPGHTLRAYVRRLDGGPLRPITSEGAITLAVSTIDPQGRWLAACATEVGPTLYSLDGGPSRHIPGTSPEEVPLGWSRDSKSVYVTMRPSEIDFPVPVYKVEVETGSRSRIMEFKGPADNAGSRRGIALVGRDAQAYVYSYNRTLDDLYLARGLR
jgi:hypothetical protein